MAELEKVIHDLPICIDFAESRGYGGLVDVMRVSLSLLKAQEPVAPEEYTVIVSQYGNAEHKCYRCGACKCGLIRNTNWRQKYCPECGRAVKWPELPKEENT